MECFPPKSCQELTWPHLILTRLAGPTDRLAGLPFRNIFLSDFLIEGSWVVVVVERGGIVVGWQLALLLLHNSKQANENENESERKFAQAKPGQHYLRLIFVPSYLPNRSSFLPSFSKYATHLSACLDQICFSLSSDKAVCFWSQLKKNDLLTWNNSTRLASPWRHTNQNESGGPVHGSILQKEWANGQSVLCLTSPTKPGPILCRQISNPQLTLAPKYASPLVLN